MQVSGMVLIDSGGPWMIGQVRRNGVPINKHDHVLHIPSSLSELTIF